MKFRKKPVVIEAIQWDGTEAGCQRIKAHFPALETLAKSGHLRKPEVTYWRIGTLEGGHEVTPGDWIIKGVKGEFYPCKPDIFAATYEPAESATGAAAQPAEPRNSDRDDFDAWILRRFGEEQHGVSPVAFEWMLETWNEARRFDDEPAAWQEPGCPRHVISAQDKRDFTNPHRNGPVTVAHANKCTIPLYTHPAPSQASGAAPCVSCPTRTTPECPLPRCIHGVREDSNA